MIDSTTAFGTKIPECSAPSRPSARARSPARGPDDGSAEGGAKGGAESVEIAFRDFAHDGDAEDGSIELPLSCIDDEPVVLQVRVQLLVGLLRGEAERRQRRPVRSL